MFSALVSGDISFRFNGSGDTTAHWLLTFSMLLVATLATIAWTLIDRHRTDPSRLHQWLRLLLRFSLGTALISYGSFKLIQSQFPAPYLARLIQPFGEASPMGVLWTFMGLSAPYNWFTGAGEFIAGVLVFFPRTVTLGSLTAIGVMSHVVMLNFSYDVPVKLFSVHLLLKAVVLLAPDFRRVFDFFVRNRGTAPADIQPLFARPRFNRAALLLRYAVLTAMVISTLYASHRQRQQMLDMQAPAPLRGIWEVEEFEMDGRVRPPLTTDISRWQRLVIDSKQAVLIKAMDGSSAFYKADPDVKQKRLGLAGGKLTYTMPKPDELVVEGPFQSSTIRVKLRRLPESKQLLINRGFHWINEAPFNR